VKFQSIQAKQKQKNLFQNLIKTWDATLATFDFDLTFCVIILSAVSLANALERVTSLEAKLQTTSKALKEANENVPRKYLLPRFPLTKRLRKRKPGLSKPKKLLPKYPKDKPIMKRML
jgi:hypothetical protein